MDQVLFCHKSLVARDRREKGTGDFGIWRGRRGNMKGCVGDYLSWGLKVIT